MADRPDLRTPDGTKLDVARSALQKSIRRGLEPEAIYWAKQLESRYPWALFRRLVVIAAEDVGLGDPHALPLVVAARQAYGMAADESPGRPPFVLVSWPVLYLCRAPKNREADDLAATIAHWVDDNGWRPTIPGYVVDLHTEEGRRSIPRDDRLRHWLDEASYITDDTGPADWRLWIRRWAARRGRLDPAQVEQQAATWHRQGRLRYGLGGIEEAAPAEEDR